VSWCQWSSAISGAFQQCALCKAGLYAVPCGLLPKWPGRWRLEAAWEPSWFLRLMWSGNAMHRLEVWRGPSFASSRWFFL
jgi:hypothetical protein